jgi:hypothetical protein
MHLFDLTDSFASASTPTSPHRIAAPGGVPPWTLGCFRRRSITYFNGVEDDRTMVIWLQSRSLTADFRQSPPSVPGSGRVSTPEGLSRLSVADLVRLARAEGGLANTHWDGTLMHWSSWDGFQTHAKWPEPGRLERVGTSMIEISPSGAYVEDWRFQPCDGRLIGLRLIDERDTRSGEVTHRGGGLVVCGRHAGFVRGRPEALPEGRLEDSVRRHVGDAAGLQRIFSCDASYGTTHATGDDFIVSLSTLPWREGQPLLSLDGFLDPEESGLVLQRVDEQNRALERRFIIDTLEPDFRGTMGTAASPTAVEWLKQEKDAILATPS